MEKSEIRFSKELREYVLFSLRESDVLKRLREETHSDPNAIMQIPPEQGQFMSFLVKVLGANMALEIGTYTGSDKGNYDHYYEKSISLLRPGGVIAIDNVLLFGSVVDPSVLDADLRSRISDADIDAMRNLNEKVKNDPRVDATMLPLADGLTLVRKL